MMILQLLSCRSPHPQPLSFGEKGVKSCMIPVSIHSANLKPFSHRERVAPKGLGEGKHAGMFAFGLMAQEWGVQSR
jgi:hypothetical protein